MIFTWTLELVFWYFPCIHTSCINLCHLTFKQAMFWYNNGNVSLRILVVKLAINLNWSKWSAMDNLTMLFKVAVVRSGCYQHWCTTTNYFFLHIFSRYCSIPCLLPMCFIFKHTDYFSCSCETTNISYLRFSLCFIKKSVCDIAKLIVVHNTWYTDELLLLLITKSYCN